MVRKQKDTKLEEMQRAVIAHHTTYAKAQTKETLEQMSPIVVPAGYRKAGERKENDSGNVGQPGSRHVRR